MFKRKIFIKLGLKLPIIIGITVSFWISEVSIDRDKIKYKNYPIQPFGLFKELRKVLPKNSAITLDAGTLCLQATDALEYYNPPSLFTPLDFGLVGFSFACGLGVKLAKPKKTVVSLMGDGGFGMKKITQQVIELITRKNPNLIVQGNDPRINFERYLQSLHQFILEDKNLESVSEIQLKYIKTKISSLKFYVVTPRELQDELRKKAKLNLYEFDTHLNNFSFRI